MVLGAFAKGMTHIYHAKRLRYKESDRIAAMETELKKLGVEISSSEDEIWIKEVLLIKAALHSRRIMIIASS